MPTVPTMLKLLNSRKSTQLNDFEAGIVYALTIDRLHGSKVVLEKLCAKVGFSPSEVDDEEAGLKEAA